MNKLIVLPAVILLALTGSAFAQTVDDMVLLAQKGVGEELMLAYLEASSAPIQLSVADIVKLKDAKVSDKVVIAMLRRHPVAAPEEQAVQAEAPVTRRSTYEASSAYQPRVDYQPAVQRVVEAPSTTYVYNDYPSYYPSYYPYYYPSYYPSYYPYYYSSYYPYCYPGLSLSFGFGRSYGRGYSSFHSGGFSNFHGGSGFGGGGFHGRR